ncbi:MAG: hypothetical protein AAF821_02070 [Cyanobacteria bacterium P01_D01_bin.156]
MTITLLHYDHDRIVASLVSAALVRSFSRAQVNSASFDSVGAENDSDIYVVINPLDVELALLQSLASQGRKIIVFGKLGVELGAELGIAVDELGDRQSGWGEIRPSLDSTFTASQATVLYNDHLLTAQLGLRHRSLGRYDFTDEWNTLGFGCITLNQGPWSLCQQARITHAISVAEVVDGQENFASTYVAIADAADSSVLWFNRQVGPIDSLEWTVIETFCSDYRADELVCIPYIAEVPGGYRSAVTMRLDCDQAIATARPLFELYQDMGMPLSLAVVTELPPQRQDIDFLRQVIAHGGSVVSHSCTHPPNWGPDYTAAFHEAKHSKQWLEEHLPEAAPIHYAVSPFHQNPPYAVNALADAGYLGFVGGIIHNDPEYLMGRSGQVPLCDKPLISHSQQCMLHGDCFHQYGNSVQPYCESFKYHLQAGALFGYLDHPFSSTYQYGWDSEAERLAAHAEFLGFIQSHDNLWFPNLVECLEFVRARSLVQVKVDDHQRLKLWHLPGGAFSTSIPPLQINWRGEKTPFLIE